MKKTSKTIVFFGSGPVAAKSLKLLLSDFVIEAVITKPKPDHHKGPVPVIELAKKFQLPVITASNHQELDEKILKKSFKSDVAILIDFGIIVSQEVINHFPLGIVNSHFSLLPKLRGADPITFAILNGEDKTGVSLMLLDKQMDTGKLFGQKSFIIPKDITTPLLTDALITISHNLLNEKLPKYLNEEIKPRKQPHPNRATYTKKLVKSDGIIDWTKPGVQIEREIRAFLGWPGSKTVVNNKDVTITKAHIVPSAPKDSKPGQINSIVLEVGEFAITAGDGTSLWVESLIPAGKREMSAKEFIIGYLNKKVYPTNS
jgi:methionyl-tRNA formyltransferase